VLKSVAMAVVMRLVLSVMGVSWCCEMKGEKSTRGHAQGTV
jgi:hypothetical protein